MTGRGQHASHGDGRGNPETDAIDNENVEAEESTAEYGEADGAEDR